MPDPVQRNPDDARLIARVAETSLRMMSGLVPRDVVSRLQARVMAADDGYPWQEVVDGVLAEPVVDSDLVNKGLVAQRDWLLRGSRTEPAAPPSAGRRPRSVQTRGKTLLAMAIVRGGFFVLYTAAVVGVLVLLRHRFPALDIYRILDGLAEVFPAVFGR